MLSSVTLASKINQTLSSINDDQALTIYIKEVKRVGSLGFVQNIRALCGL